MSILDKKSDIHYSKLSQSGERIYNELKNSCINYLKRIYRLDENLDTINTCDKIKKIMDNNMFIRGADFYRRNPTLGVKSTGSTRSARRRNRKI